MRVIPIADISHIPKGHYCYTGLGWDGIMYNIKTCPYWELINKNHARCNRFNIDDERDGTILWDQVKECGMNIGDDDAE